MSDQLIGNYRVIKQIGAGGMAKVYLAVHKDIPNLRVILKILTDPRLVQRFKQEADKLALLDGNPNICRIKHFFTHGENVVIAMEYIDGVSLDQKLDAEGKLAVGESARIVSKVLEILEFAHQRNIYHRDIKPSNIMIDKSGTVKIIDFGIAKSESDPNLTVAGAACGTPSYMAPEQFTPTDKTNYALVDIYACGTTLYRMLTGELPFKGANEFALRDAKLFSEPPSPRALASGIPKALDSCILKALQKEPEARFQSAGEMQKQLATFFQESVAAESEQTVDFSIGRRSTKKQLPTKTIIIAAVLLFLASVVGWYSMQPTEPVPPQIVTLLTPTDGTQFTDNRTPTLSWSETAGVGGSYILEYASNLDFVDGHTIAGLASTSYTFGSDLQNDAYYWRIYAVGNNGLRSDPSEQLSFAVAIAATAAPQATLIVVAAPKGDISIDGDLLGRGLDRIESVLDTGRHIIRVANRGSVQKVFLDTVFLTEGQEITRTFRFTLAPAPTPKLARGEVRIGSRPRGADIFIDSELQPQRTNYTFLLAPGRHIIRTRLKAETGDQERTDTIQVVADSTHKLIVDFE